MQSADELKIIAKNHRWAYEELTYDLCYQERNRMEGDVPFQLRYLRRRWGSLSAVKSAIRARPAGEVYAYWLFDRVTDEKEKEAYELCQGIKSMYDYLRRFYSREQLLEVLAWLVVHQKRRRKTLGVFQS